MSFFKVLAGLQAKAFFNSQLPLTSSLHLLSVPLQQPSQPYHSQFPTMKEIWHSGKTVFPCRSSHQVARTASRHCCRHLMSCPRRSTATPYFVSIKIQTSSYRSRTSIVHLLVLQPSPWGSSPSTPHVHTPNSGPSLYSKDSMSYC